MHRVIVHKYKGKNIKIDLLRFSIFLLLVVGIITLISLHALHKPESAEAPVELVESLKLTTLPVAPIEENPEPTGDVEYANEIPAPPVADEVKSETVIIEETPPAASSQYVGDIPLDSELQSYIISLSNNEGIDPYIVFGVIYRESRYNPSSIGDGGKSLGLMQIQPKWFGKRMQELGLTNLLDPYQNVRLGIDYLGSLYRSYGDIETALIVYNAGAGGANRLYFSKGIYSNSYSQSVLAHADSIRTI